MIVPSESAIAMFFIDAQDPLGTEDWYLTLMYELIYIKKLIQKKFFFFSLSLQPETVIKQTETIMIWAIPVSLSSLTCNFHLFLSAGFFPLA